MKPAQNQTTFWGQETKSWTYPGKKKKNSFMQQAYGVLPQVFMCGRLVDGENAFWPRWDFLLKNLEVQLKH